MIRRIHHIQITIPPEMEDEARAFYCTILGLQEIEKPPLLKPRGGFWLEIADQQIHVGVEEESDRTRTKAHVAYEVENLAHWKDQLELLGVPIGDSVPILGWNRFEFRDPFGNRVELIESISPELTAL